MFLNKIKPDCILRSIKFENDNAHYGARYFVAELQNIEMSSISLIKNYTTTTKSVAVSKQSI